MAEWSICPACGLKHTARADGECPRCHASLAQPAGGPPPLPAEPSAPGLAGGVVSGGMVAAATPDGSGPLAPFVPTDMPSAPPAAAPFPLGARLAGAVLLANVVVNLVILAKTGHGPGEASLGQAGLLSNLVDLAVGGCLVAGLRNARGVALVRVALGAAILTPLAWASGGALQGCLQLAFSLGLLLLLVGRAGPWRIAAGLVPTGGLLVLLLGLTLDPGLGRSARALAADLADRGAHLALVESAPGAAVAWRLPLPGERWHAEHLKVPNLERAVGWPEEDAHLLIFVKQVPAGAGVDLEKAAAGMVSGARQGEKSLVEVERRRLLTRRGQALAVRCTTSKPGEETDGWYVAHATDDKLAFVIALAPAARPPEVGEALLAVASGLDL